MVSFTPRPALPLLKTVPLPIEYGVGCAIEPAWTFLIVHENIYYIERFQIHRINCRYMREMLYVSNFQFLCTMVTTVFRFVSLCSDRSLPTFRKNMLRSSSRSHRKQRGSHRRGKYVSWSWSWEIETCAVVVSLGFSFMLSEFEWFLLHCPVSEKLICKYL
jgi:hypothetical protein